MEWNRGGVVCGGIIWGLSEPIRRRGFAHVCGNGESGERLVGSSRLVREWRNREPGERLGKSSRGARLPFAARFGAGGR